MKAKKVRTRADQAKKLSDKTDWNRVCGKSQDAVDHDAMVDSENPVLKSGKIRRLNDEK
ncbi:hypothetical protein [Endozoicomonas numazuensis]|uniref:hypothetical protein n=1 Tax=Endozoicomonas numazuensis TaxID=1137799 RepID=UPI000A611362|nr:hypothetical protein [Endozoicomonas numazuensis]